MHVHSPYLVDRLLSTPDECLFNYVKYRCVRDMLRSRAARPLRIVDLGCGNQVAHRYLDDLGVELQYVGVDHEAALAPDLTLDLAGDWDLSTELPWRPNVLLMLDLLEHLDGGEQAIRCFLARARSLLDENGIGIITLPQMYRLDRFKLPHLCYSEHKVRYTQAQWLRILSESWGVEKVHGFSYLSVIPHLLMFNRRYKDDGALGRLFHRLRGKTFERPVLKPIDYKITKWLGHLPLARELGNDFLVCVRP